MDFKQIKDYEANYKNLLEQIKYLEKTEDEITEAYAKSRQEIREEITRKRSDLRKVLKEQQDEIKDSKIFEFDVKIKELNWLLTMYTNEEEIQKVKSQLIDIKFKMEEWLSKYENRCILEEKEMDDKEEDEDKRLARKLSMIKNKINTNFFNSSFVFL